MIVTFATSLFVGLEGYLCQCPHRSFVLRGQLTATEAEGVQVAVNENDLFTGHRDII